MWWWCGALTVAFIQFITDCFTPRAYNAIHHEEMMIPKNVLIYAWDDAHCVNNQLEQTHVLVTECGYFYQVAMSGVVLVLCAVNRQPRDNSKNKFIMIFSSFFKVISFVVLKKHCATISS